MTGCNWSVEEQGLGEDGSDGVKVVVKVGVEIRVRVGGGRS